MNNFATCCNTKKQKKNRIPKMVQRTHMYKAKAKYTAQTPTGADKSPPAHLADFPNVLIISELYGVGVGGV